MENKFIHTIKSCWLCLRFPFLYPRNRFSGRHQVGALRGITSKLHQNSIQNVSVTGELEKTLKNYYHKTLTFFDIHVILVGDEKLIISNKNDTKEQDLKHITGNDDKFEILGIDLVFSMMGTPIVKVIVQPKDKNDKTNYGFGWRTVELITNKRKNFCYKVIKWIDSEILDRILFIPTWNELDAMPSGWRKAFGIQMCKELKAQLKKDHYLYKYRIAQIKEKFGYLHWYDEGASKEVYDIIDKYEDISYKTCIVCGKPATKLSGGWISPYCDEHFPEHEHVYQEMKDGHWVPVNEDTTDYQTIVEMEAEKLCKDPSKIKEAFWDAINDITDETTEK